MTANCESKLMDADVIVVRRSAFDGCVRAIIDRADRHHPQPFAPLPMTNLARRMSPTGFEYGYGGSGPAALAHSILYACCGPLAADRWYGEFKWQYVAPAHGPCWTIKVGSVREWVRHQERLAQRQGKTHVR